MFMQTIASHWHLLIFILIAQVILSNYFWKYSISSSDADSAVDLQTLTIANHVA